MDKTGMVYLPDLSYGTTRVEYLHYLEAWSKIMEEQEAEQLQHIVGSSTA